MKISLFYISLVLFILGWLLLFQPYDLPGLQESAPMLRFQNFQVRQMDTNGTNLILSGRYGLYKHRQIYIVSPRIRLVGRDERLRAQRGIYKVGIVRLRGDVAYSSKLYRFYTQKANYVIDKELIYTPTPFEFESPELNMSGSKLFYLRKNGKIVAYDIDAKALIR
ncbi:MAG: LPS export ABC transporter periplasmic protein LptC [Epsilonproteobacteria bacterium]|nr:LPS export ABC transporter periplasmic protein LptC [Campylobacterota bacterium]